MQSEDIRDLLMMDDTGSNNYFDADLDLNQDIDPLYVAADLQPRCISAITAGIDLNEKFAGLCEVKESYADNSSGELMSDDYDSTTLSKRQAPGSSQPRKKRLRGADLIQSLKRNPIFRDHDELFEENLDDLTRKKLMQKIRNRVSAQESRDRKKMQMGSLAEKNFILEKDNANLRAEVEELKNENKMLRKKLDEASSTKSNSNGTGKTDSESTNVEKSSYNSDVNLNLFKDEDSSILGRAFKRRPSNDSGLGWKAFMMIAIGVALCCVTLPGSPAGGEVVKSSAIVPMIGANAPKANSHALVRLEQICKDYCIQKECSRCQKLLDQQMLGKHFLNLDTDIVLRNVSSVNLTLPSGGMEGLNQLDLYQSADYLSNSGPYSTMFCSEQIELDKSSNLVRKDDYIHFIFPKDKESVIGEAIDQEPGNMGSQLHSEYVGILAKVVSKKDIRVFQNKNVVNAI